MLGYCYTLLFHLQRYKILSVCKHQCLLVLEGEPTQVALLGPGTAGQ